MWSLATNQTQVVARHDAPIRHLFSVKDMSNMLVTGGWDKTVRYWDLRQPNPVHVQQLPERVYAMDVRYPLAVVGLANRRIQVRLQPSGCLASLVGTLRGARWHLLKRPLQQCTCQSQGHYGTHAVVWGHCP